MKKAILTIFVAGFILSVLAAEESKDAGVIHLEHSKIAPTFASGGPLLVTNNFKVQAGRRIAPGEVEIHANDTDVFYILEGTATFVTGGKAIETKETAPGETRGLKIEGGVERHLAKGDVIVIPNGVPHWFKEVNGEFRYFVVKVR